MSPDLRQTGAAEDRVEGVYQLSRTIEQEQREKQMSVTKSQLKRENEILRNQVYGISTMLAEKTLDLAQRDEQMQQLIMEVR